MDSTRGQFPRIDPTTAAALLAPLTDIVAEAGAAVLRIDRRAAKLNDKADGSPLTSADLAADRIIAAGLARVMPQLPVISEERIDALAGGGESSFFIVDPIDGTKEYIAGHDD